MIHWSMMRDRWLAHYGVTPLLIWRADIPNLYYWSMGSFAVTGRPLGAATSLFRAKCEVQREVDKLEAALKH